MIRFMMTLMVLSFASISFAQSTCDTKLTLTCEATYKAEYQDMETLTASSSLVDENWDEPSLANCAATVYFTTGATTVRVYATKELSNNTVTASASASHVEKIVIDGRSMTRADYSNFVSSKSVAGAAFDAGTLKLPRPLDNGTTEVSVKCVVK